MATTTSSTSASTLYEKPTYKYTLENNSCTVDWSVHGPSDVYKIHDNFNPNKEPDWEKRYWDISKDLLDMQVSKNKLKEELDKAKGEAEALRKALGGFIGKPI